MQPKSYETLFRSAIQNKLPELHHLTHLWQQTKKHLQQTTAYLAKSTATTLNHATNWLTHHYQTAAKSPILHSLAIPFPTLFSTTTTPDKTSESSSPKQKSSQNSSLLPPSRKKKSSLRWLWITLAIILIIFLIWLFLVPKGKQTQANVATVQEKTLTSTVSVTGEVSADQHRMVNFESGGEIAYIKVEVGDQVTRGQSLAELDQDDLEFKVQKAQSGLLAAQVERQKTAQDYDLQEQQEAVRKAQLQLQTAQSDLATTKSNNQKELEQQALQVAQANLNLATSQEDLEKTEATSAQDVAIAELDKEHAEDNFEDAYDTPAINRDQYEQAYEKAIENKVKTDLGREATLTNRESNVAADNLRQKTALKDLEVAQVTNRNKEIKAQNAVDTAAADLEAAKVKLAKLQAEDPLNVKSAQSKEAEAEVALAEANLALENAELTAPFAGTITRVEYEEGELYAPNTEFIEIADLTKLQIEVDVSETDIVDVKVGQTVKLDFDALPDEIFEGRVAKIDPGPTIIQGVVNYKVTITFDQDERIRLGMTVNIEIITAESKNTLVIPQRALSKNDEGQDIVTVRINGKEEERIVKTGIRSGIDVQILEGLSKDDEVVI